MYITVNGKRVESCPLWGTGDNPLGGTIGWCSVKEITCSYGLTEIHVPKECPLRKKLVKKVIRLRPGNF